MRTIWSVLWNLTGKRWIQDSQKNNFYSQKGHCLTTSESPNLNLNAFLYVGLFGPFHDADGSYTESVTNSLTISLLLNMIFWLADADMLCYKWPLYPMALEGSKLNACDIIGPLGPSQDIAVMDNVCTCVTKHWNAFRTFLELNWLKNSKRIWHEQKLHISCLPLSQNFDLWAFGGFSFIWN